jgi:threonine dehydratase
LEGADLIASAMEARERLSDLADSTPLEASETLSYGSNRVLVKRADHLPGGCFKFLSAVNAVAGLREEGYEDFYVPTAGSYGIGVGHAVQIHGGRARAVMPEGANPEKRQLMGEMGVEVLEYGDNFDQADAYARQLAEESDGKYLHPFASTRNLAATGVLGLELGEQSPDMTHLALQVGGGSLFGGAGPVIKGLRPDVQLGAFQVTGCSPFVDSLRSGEVREARDVSSHIMPSWFAKLGGVGVGKTHPLTLGVGSRAADFADTVSSADVYATMHDFRQEHGVLPEFAAAVGLEGARKLARSRSLSGATIVAVLTGNHADSYREGYLESMSGRRQKDESRFLVPAD